MDTEHGILLKECPSQFAKWGIQRIKKQEKKIDEYYEKKEPQLGMDSIIAKVFSYEDKKTISLVAKPNNPMRLWKDREESIKKCFDHKHKTIIYKVQ